MSQRLVVGVDLGGTNVRACVLNEHGEEAGPRIEQPSRAREGIDACLDAMTDAILLAAAGLVPESVGLAIPGHIDGGIVRWAPNFGEIVDGQLRAWRDVPIAEPLKERTGLTVHMSNDANLAALGEYRFGSGEGKASALVLFTLGTGVGGGVVLGARSVVSLSSYTPPPSPLPISPSSKQGGGESRAAMLVGGNRGGVELGHTIVEANGRVCSCGARGCLEAYCGAAGLIATANSLMSSDTASTPKDLFDAAEREEPHALAVWHNYGFYLGIGIGNAINVFAPEIVAIAGQIAKASKHFLQRAEDVARSNAVPSLEPDSQIVVAEQIDDAGILGAAALALESGE